MARPTDPTHAGSCWDCGYSLRGLPDDARRCPDCGREFDPDDSKSINRGKPPGWIARRLLVPPGWPTVGFAAIAAGMVLWGTGGVTGFSARFDDWPMLFRSLRGRELWGDGFSNHWKVYACGAGLAGMLTLWLVGRLLLRAAFALRYRPPGDFRRGRYGIAVSTALLLGVCYIWAACGSAPRVGREWARSLLSTGAKAKSYVFVAPPIDLSKEHRNAVVRAVALGGDSPAERRMAMLLAHLGGPAIYDPPLWQAAAAREKDADLLAAELRFLAMHRDTQPTDFVAHYLDDPRPTVRAAAADSLGLIHFPAYRYGVEQGDWDRLVELSLAGQPEIPLGFLMQRGATTASYGILDPHAYPFFNRYFPLSPQHRDRLTQMMLDGPTLDEREAAARALLPQPPEGYRFRFSEWGVWLNESGDLKMAKAVAEEIPPFVHRTGNPVATMGGYLQPVMFVTKPVIHLTVSQPMAVDIEVMIRHGRPWFAYPMPDDFEVFAKSRQGPFFPARNTPSAGPAATMPAPFLATLDPPVGFGSLPSQSLRSGYPWAAPAHRKSGPTGGFGATFNDITSWGVHWQSVIVTPTKQTWMKEPQLGGDPKHAWWRRLRDVDCSWVSSRGESERFLYYDGPTRLKLAFTPTFDGTTLRWPAVKPGPEEETLPRIWPPPSEEPLRKGRKPKSDEPWLAMAVRVSGDDGGRVECAWVVPGVEVDPFDRSDHKVADGAQAGEAMLRRAILARGMNDTESAGLLDTWRQAFFSKPGTRVLLLIPEWAYGFSCPIAVN
ncbi:MAG TPA: HEAT repeat domain-containing protein, partial [Tepidisphaeraceae bacterium]|nr:HEAT repeat domain-containing protein [Tepidisphaeraceae bacterium]